MLQLSSRLTLKQMFLLDSIGALISAIMLGCILPLLEFSIGMPKQTLYFLAFIALLFFLHSLWSFRNSERNPRLRLKLIATANLLYCCITLALTLFHYNSMTILGLIYFGGEIMIIIALSALEFKIASK